VVETQTTFWVNAENSQISKTAVTWSAKDNGTYILLSSVCDSVVLLEGGGQKLFTLIIVVFPFLDYEKGSPAWPLCVLEWSNRWPLCKLYRFSSNVSDIDHIQQVAIL